MSRYCIIYNFAPHYRKAVFGLMDREWDCEWHFGKPASDVKELDTGFLNTVHSLKNRYTKSGVLFWQRGVGPLIRDKRYDRYIVLGELKNLSTWWLLIQRRLFFPKKKIYLWSHGWYGREDRSKRLLKRLYFGMADHTFTYGEHARRQAERQGLNPKDITPVHNSLDYTVQSRIREALSSSEIYRRRFGNSNPTLLFIGRLTPVKQLDSLLRAVGSLKEDGTRYNLVLVGSGECEENLKKEAARLGISDSVWFYGPSYDEKTNAELIYNADICVAPGNVGLTAIHSMSFGTPVLTHNDFSRQMPEFEAIREGKTGGFFRFGDEEDMGRAIRSWIESHPDREAVRNECVNEIERFWTPEFQIRTFRSVLERDDD